MATNLADRRTVLTGAAALLAAGAARAQSVTLPFDNGERPIKTYPEKRPMLVLTERPPQLETPFEVFDHGAFTPNDAFFVRYHLAGTPPRGLDAATHRVKVLGAVERPLDLSLADLRRDFPAVEIAAVNECSGNGRGFSSPRVAGGQLGEGMMGNARWRGVTVKALLDRAGVKAGAHAVEFNGADKPQLASVADFVKGLGVDHARGGEVMLAYEMNGAPLPLLNGYPLRLIVPGYYGTYWVKHITDLTVLEQESQSYWMQKAYRIPDNDCACVPAGTAPPATRPIGKLNVRSFITNLADGQSAKASPRTLVRGVAFDGGSGIAGVELSTDGGKTWTPASLGQDHGKYSFREWSAHAPLAAGEHQLVARATSKAGDVQPLTASWNPSAYMRNAADPVRVIAA
ncbi:molybdopterin-dependent oxidoreductase [Phenylobacterium sp.]|uniref:molybdopterin-dependent oxidoreductase n=1 Tax=Phenylobacterium sp. TaxID=1871053 RepID=UPI002CAE01E8|nr:molybdopterin-dependent oxidoreductase [Phenylobacterium sp.]HLZ75785.1 molybdopterin-dependent oxidoreductase [Phenylobacterium sp.]